MSVFMKRDENAGAELVGAGGTVLRPAAELACLPQTDRHTPGVENRVVKPLGCNGRHRG